MLGSIVVYFVLSEIIAIREVDDTTLRKDNTVQTVCERHKGGVLSVWQIAFDYL